MTMVLSVSKAVMPTLSLRISYSRSGIHLYLALDVNSHTLYY